VQNYCDKKFNWVIYYLCAESTAQSQLQTQHSVDIGDYVLIIYLHTCKQEIKTLGPMGTQKW
jgi:hypothetical protein